jgi:hypothetical protein
MGLRRVHDSSTIRPAPLRFPEVNVTDITNPETGSTTPDPGRTTRPYPGRTPRGSPPRSTGCSGRCRNSAGPAAWRCTPRPPGNRGPPRSGDTTGARRPGLLPALRDDLTLDWAVDDGRTDPIPGCPSRSRAAPDWALRPGRGRGGAGPGAGRRHPGPPAGQGGGSYDRALPLAHPSALVLALVHDEELLDAAVERCRPIHTTPRSAGGHPTRWLRFTATTPADGPAGPGRTDSNRPPENRSLRRHQAQLVLVPGPGPLPR